MSLSDVVSVVERDRTGELRERVASGSDHALFELAGWLARRFRVDELREPFAGRLELLVNWLAGPCDVGDMRLVRLSAELGDEATRQRLERWLTRLRERADAGDEHAQGFLAENPVVWPSDS